MVDGDGLEKMLIMRNVLLHKHGDEPCMDTKFKLEINGSNKVYFKIHLNKGLLVFNKSQFLNITVRKLFAFKNLSDPVTIDIITECE